MITVRLNGVDYTNFDRVAVYRSMEDVSGAFSFSSSANSDNLFPIKKGDALQIIVDENQVLDGFVEKLNVDYDSRNHSITASGRDKLADLIDSSVSGEKEFTGSVSLVQIAESILAGLSLSEIKVIDETDEIKPFEETEITSAEVGENSFEFLELYARKRQVLLSTDGIGNLLMQRASTDIFKGRIRNTKPDNDQNNVLSGEFETDDTQRFNKYIAQSQLNPFSLDEGTTPEQISNQNGVAVDSAIRESRMLEFNTEESSDDFTSTERAAWEANIRRARSLSYKPKVQGHSVNGEVWRPNILVRVQDDFAAIQATMLIRSVTYEQTLNEGSTTTLDLTYRDAYTLQAEQDEREANTDDAGFGFEL